MTLDTAVRCTHAEDGRATADTGAGGRPPTTPCNVHSTGLARWPPSRTSHGTLIRGYKLD